MNLAFLALLHDLSPHWKILLASVVAASAAVADVLTDAKGWSELPLPVILGCALVFVFHLMLKQQAEHKEERAASNAAQQASAEKREERMVAAMSAQAEALEKVAALTEEQTTYFKTVTRNIVDQHIGVKGSRKIPD